MTMTDAQRLRQGAARIRHGWVQGVPFQMTNDGVDRVCAMGSLSDWEHYQSFCEEGEQLAALICRAVGILPDHTTPRCPCFNAITAWNDGDDQTAENVAQGLELAAMLAEQEQPQDVPVALVGVGV